MCQGYDHRAVAELLRKRGHLETEAGRLTSRFRLPGHGREKVPCYHIKATIFEDEL